ncbi:MAG: hypothetical protein QNJ97_16295 [Myxococcota bacterium]|nr:hypothetical protein [Myxococcota bacterium]
MKISASVLIGVLLSALMLTLACNPEYKHLAFTELSHPPSAISLVSDRIEIGAGIGIMVEATPKSGNSEPYGKRDKVELQSENSDVFRVVAGQKRREFALIGISPGETRLRVIIEGSHVDDIRVIVK